MEQPPDKALAFLPGQHLIDSYGDGGFRFSGYSHKGSLLALPSGIYEWNPKDPTHISYEDFEILLKETDNIEFLYIGTGEKNIFLAASLKRALRERNIRSIETMTTGMAAQTYNILVAENRKVAVALIAVD